MSGEKGSRRKRICFWTTTFQADILSLVYHLSSRSDYECLVLLDDPDGFRDEAISRLRPLGVRFLDRSRKTSLAKAKLFRADLLVVDNHFPPIKLAPRLVNIWHGLGWKHDNMVGEFVHVHNAIHRLVGGARERNPNFKWLCYGEPEVEWRRDVSGVTPDNCVVVGMAQSDDLLSWDIPIEDVAPFYTIDIGSRPTILIALTWHGGKVFSSWGDESSIYRELFAFADEAGVNIVFRMHDRFRYEASYLRMIEEVAAPFPHVMFKYKDSERDNLVDLCVSSVCVSDYSSILNRFYVTGKPSIHLYRGEDDGPVVTRKVQDGSVVEEEVDEGINPWRYDPDDHGGLKVSSLEELKAAIVKAIAEPRCCSDSSKAWLERNVFQVDGHTCERIEKVLRGMCGD